MSRIHSRRNSASRPSGGMLAGFRLGYVPLIDAAPFLVADALGFFTKAGLRVRLSRELGWGSIREKIVYGEIDGASIPGGLLYSILLGSHAPACPVSTDLVMNLQGNAITLSRRLWEKGVRDARTFRLVVRGEAPRRMTLAVVSQFSSHHFLLRSWLRAAGLDPDRDVRITVLPPPLVADHMREGQIEGFCAGEPWNSGAAFAGDGWVVATSAALAPGHPEKVLAMRNDSTAGEPQAYAALRKALVEACRYCDQPENRAAVADLLVERAIFPLPAEALRNSLVGPFYNGFATDESSRQFISFYRNGVNRATRERAAWCLGGVIESRGLAVDQGIRRRCLDAFIDDECPPRTTARTASVRSRKTPACIK
ncbi:MAG: CmpA/NrtA family ABC transporter substrate-binding protein [Terrimicrobiaceae bacterium]|nr:CmpA/NrtA family ABC transporter substrate-binding protein [Terrimicrobiaceae bacterium]